MLVVGLPLFIGWKFRPGWMMKHLDLMWACAAVLWTLKTYLEQMLMAELYLWARCQEWEEFRRAGDPVTAPEARIMPSLFNDVPDLQGRVRADR
jgi:hypothetical protein